MLDRHRPNHRFLYLEVKTGDSVLNAIGVLVFVDIDVAKALLIRVKNDGIFGQRFKALTEDRQSPGRSPVQERC